MKAILVAVLLVAGLVSGCSSDSAPTPTSTAEVLATRFFSILQSGDRQDLEQFLSPAFQLMRADGSTADKTQYLENPAQVEDFELGDFVAGEDSGVLTTTYTVTTTETIDGREYAQDPLPRASTFEKTGDDWQIVAHANLSNPADPVAEMVEASPITNPSAPEVRAAAKALQKSALQAVTERDSQTLSSLTSPGFLLLRADGTSADRDTFVDQPPGITAYKVRGFGVTDTDQVVVARFIGTYALEVDGKAYPARPAPQLSVMVGEAPNLRIMSIVNFNKPMD